MGEESACGSSEFRHPLSRFPLWGKAGAGGFPPSRRHAARQQKTLARIEHPLIAQIHDAGTLDDGTPWFVMEYVEGRPITDYCREHASSIDERLRLFRSACAPSVKGTVATGRFNVWCRRPLRNP